MRTRLTGASTRFTSRILPSWLLETVTVASLLWLIALPDQAAAQPRFTEEGGTLPDGTVYLMRVPVNWNKTLIRDLDYASGADRPRYQSLLEKGYALSGTRRHQLRIFQYDPAREIANLDSVLDRFEARFGKPARVIQFGCSGGGHVALAVAENFSDRIDGAIAMAAHTPVWLMNTYLDGWFSLKALLAPDLVITSLPNTESYGPSGHGTTGAMTTAWRQAIDAAQQTPQGRARIALAFTIGVAGLGKQADCAAEPRGCRCASAQHVPRCFPECIKPWWRSTGHVRERGQQSAALVEHRSGLQRVVREW
jgi:hypothetical protein